MTPKATLKAALPGLGFTLSTDFATIWNSLLRRAQRLSRRGPVTRGDMAAVVARWIELVTEARADGGRPLAPYALDAAIRVLLHDPFAA